MQFRIASRSLACSTLVMGDICNLENFFDFLDDLEAGIEYSQKSTTKETYWAHWEPEHKGVQHVLDGYDVSEFAFIIATTEPRQKIAEKHLKTLGFMSTFERTFNLKNDTEVHFHFIPVPLLIENIKRIRSEEKKKIEKLNGLKKLEDKKVA